MDGKGAAENELMFFAVSGSYYVYVQAAAWRSRAGRS